jgi:GntR family transcriptional regulator, transcriptional repressor for pyruvate dehydrogenase complex
MQADNAQMPNSQIPAQVINYIRAKIEDGALKPGDKIPPERELAKILNMSRASLRTGIGCLASMGIMKVRRGTRTCVADRSDEIGYPSLESLSALYGLEPWQVFEARKLLECNLATLAAERGKEEHFAMLAEEIVDMYATIDDPAEYLIHDVSFHRSIARASGNPILALLMETVLRELCKDRRYTLTRVQDRRIAVEEHREIYRAIRKGDPTAACIAMRRHLQSSESGQVIERSISRYRHMHLQKRKPPRT